MIMSYQIPTVLGLSNMAIDSYVMN